jgi:hypothetical protein
MLHPNIAMDLFEQTIARRVAGLPGPWAVLPSPPKVFSVADAAVIERDHVARWLEAHP